MRITKRFYEAVALFFAVLIVGAGAFVLFNGSSSVPNELLASPVDYYVARDVLLGIVKEDDPREALELFKRALKKNNALLGFCHPLVHEMGRATYLKYEDFATALVYADPICSSGFVHGVIEGYFHGARNIEALARDACANYNPHSFKGAECFHGVGHGLMFYSDNDLPWSLQLCGRYSDSFARESCESGAFMENFNYDEESHPSKFLDPDNPMYPCAEQMESQKKYCYGYAPIYFLALHPEAYDDAFEWCAGAEENFKNACAGGVGAQIAQLHVNDSEFIVSACGRGDFSQRAPCVYGAVTLLIGHHGALSPAKKFCEKVSLEEKKICTNAVSASAPLFAP